MLTQVISGEQARQNFADNQAKIETQILNDCIVQFNDQVSSPHFYQRIHNALKDGRKTFQIQLGLKSPHGDPGNVSGQFHSYLESAKWLIDMITVKQSSDDDDYYWIDIYVYCRDTEGKPMWGYKK